MKSWCGDEGILVGVDVYKLKKVEEAAARMFKKKLGLE